MRMPDMPKPKKDWKHKITAVTVNKASLSTDLYKYSPDAVPPIHARSYHVATDNPLPRWRQVPVYF